MNNNIKVNQIVYSRFFLQYAAFGRFIESLSANALILPKQPINSQTVSMVYENVWQKNRNFTRRSWWIGCTLDCMHWIVFRIVAYLWSLVILYTNGVVSVHENVLLNAGIEPTKCKLIDERVDRNAGRSFLNDERTQWLFPFSNFCP